MIHTKQNIIRPNVDVIAYIGAHIRTSLEVPIRWALELVAGSLRRARRKGIVVGAGRPRISVRIIGVPGSCWVLPAGRQLPAPWRLILRLCVGGVGVARVLFVLVRGRRRG